MSKDYPQIRRTFIYEITHLVVVGRKTLFALFPVSATIVLRISECHIDIWPVIGFYSKCSLTDRHVTWLETANDNDVVRGRLSNILEMSSGLSVCLRGVARSKMWGELS